MSSKEGLLDKLRSAIIDLDLEEAKRASEEVIKSGISAYEAIMSGVMEGSRIVGKKYEDREYFLAELMAVAEIMKVALEILEPYLKAEERARMAGRVVIGTVKGDLHDIGKNIVCALLRSAGFEVYDLGVDVPAEKFVEKVKEVNADIVGISCLLTTTMPYIKEIVDALRTANLRENVLVLVGGVPLNPEYAKEFKADVYCKEAMEGARIAEEYMKKKKRLGGGNEENFC